MQIALCDDNELYLLDMKEKLSELPMVENAFFFSELPLFLSAVAGGHFFDAVLMDIDWGQDSTGMDAAAELYRHSPETKVIYVTGHSDKYSQHIFLNKANLSGFIAKPVDMEILKANLEKVAGEIPLGEQPMLMVRHKGRVYSIPFREIYYLESRKHTTTIHNTQEPVISYERLEKIMETLPAGFYQCHKSYIVNMRRIQRFEPDGVLLKNGDYVPVSRSKYAGARDAYLSFIGKTF